MTALPVWLPAYVGLGSNLGDPPLQLRTALVALAGLPDTRLIAQSPCYWNPPLSGSGQPEYLNGVAALLTQLAAPDLLARLLAIECDQGRDRRQAERWASRTLDLDLLVYADRVICEPGLTVPHPGILQRNFVLLPLCDIAPDLVIPGCGRVADLAGSAATAGLRRQQM